MPATPTKPPSAPSQHVKRALRAAILAAAVPASLHAQQGHPASTTLVSLPDAPGRDSETASPSNQTREQQAPGSIRGTILDINEHPVPGARVTLAAEGRPGEIVVTSNDEGQFTCPDLAPGKWSFTVTSAGLETFVSAEITLHPGEAHTVPTIALPIAATSTEVQVTVTQYELAEEEIKAAEKQRVLGIIPNFYSSYLWNAAPLAPKQKFELAFRSRTDPIAFVSSGIVAGLEQARNRFPGYGQGAQGYGKRYGASYATGAISRFLGSAVLPSVLHQDPRYFYKGSGSIRSRALYAMSRTFITRGNNGRPEPNYSQLLGSFAAGGISNLYHPAGDRGATLTVQNALIGTASNSVANLVREFFLRALTPSVPASEKGQPKPAVALAVPPTASVSK